MIVERSPLQPAMKNHISLLLLFVLSCTASAGVYVDYEDVPIEVRLLLANQQSPGSLTSWGAAAYVYGYRSRSDEWRFMGMASLAGHGRLALSNAHVFFDCTSGEARAERFVLQMVGGAERVAIDMAASEFGRRIGCSQYISKDQDWAVLALRENVLTTFSDRGYYALLVERRFSEDDLLLPATRHAFYLPLDFKQTLNLRKHCMAPARSDMVPLNFLPSGLVFVGCPGIRDGRSGSVGHYLDGNGHRQVAFTIQFDQQRRTALDQRGRLTESVIPSGGILFEGTQRQSFERLYVRYLDAPFHDNENTVQSVRYGSSDVSTMSPVVLPGIGSNRADRGF
jgi:hypothetical protein